MLIATTYASNVSLFTNTIEIGDFILIAIAVIVLFSGVAAIAFILWWGVLLILSWWKDDKIKPAINSIRYAVVGLILIVVSIFIFPRLAGLLGLDVEAYSSPDKIFQKIEEIGTKIFRGNSSEPTFEGLDGLQLGDDFSDL